MLCSRHLPHMLGLPVSSTDVTVSHDLSVELRNTGSQQTLCDGVGGDLLLGPLARFMSTPPT
jgi:hypothetical protein